MLTNDFICIESKLKNMKCINLKTEGYCHYFSFDDEITYSLLLIRWYGESIGRVGWRDDEWRAKERRYLTIKWRKRRSRNQTDTYFRILLMINETYVYRRYMNERCKDEINSTIEHLDDKRRDVSLGYHFVRNDNVNRSRWKWFS